MPPAVASPLARSRSTRTTLAPPLAKPSAVARPMPLAPPVISATLPVKSGSMAFLPSWSIPAPDQSGPFLEVYKHVADEPARRVVGQSARGIEFGLRLADQHLGLVQRVHVEKDAAAAQVVLRARSAGHAGAGTHDSHGLAGKGLIGRARGPVDRVLQDAGHRVV